MMHRRLALQGILATFAAAVAFPSLAAVEVSDAWVRGTVQGQKSSGAYMVIHSDKDVTLVGVEAEVAQHATVHEMHMHDNMMMMMPVERLAVPAGKAVVLDEHGYHLMLDDLKHQLKPGERVILRLQFADTQGHKQDVQVAAPVRELSAHGAGPADAEHAGHEGHMHDGMGNK